MQLLGNQLLFNQLLYQYCRRLGNAGLDIGHTAHTLTRETPDNGQLESSKSLGCLGAKINVARSTAARSYTVGETRESPRAGGEEHWGKGMEK